MQDVINWLGEDWRTRKNLEGWMLYNLSIALRNKGRDSDAVEVCRHGLTLAFDHDVHQRFTVWIAFHAALAGNTEEGKHHLSQVKADTLAEHHKWLEGFTRAMIEVQSVPPPERLNAFKKAGKIIQDIKLGWVLHAEKDTRRAYWRTLKRMKFDCGSVRPFLWGAFHQYRYLTISLPVAFVSLLAIFVRPELGLLFLISMIFSLFYYAKKE